MIYSFIFFFETANQVVVTTSRDPSSRLKQFAKEVRLLFPNAQRMNRGGHVIDELVNVCRANEVTDLIIVHEHRGEPDGLVIRYTPMRETRKRRVPVLRRAGRKPKLYQWRRC